MIAEEKLAKVVELVYAASDRMYRREHGIGTTTSPEHIAKVTAQLVRDVELAGELAEVLA